MAQHDYIISNQSGAAFRSDLNNALSAIVSLNSGASAPSTTYAYQPWADTTTGLLKIRNAANSAWITLRELDGTLTIEDGSASTPGLAFASDLNTGLYRVGADQLGFATGGTGRLFVDASGRVGIGNATPQDSFSITGGGFSFSDTGGAIRNISWKNLTDNIAPVFIRGDAQNGTLAFSTNTLGNTATERARIDSSGKLLVGTSTSLSAGNWSDSLVQIRGNSSGSTFEGKLALFTGRTIAAGIGAGETLGRVAFGNGEGGEAAWITAQADAGWSSSDYPGRLVFSTTADAASSPTERLRITSAGILNLNGQRTGFSTPMSGSGNVRVAAASAGGIALSTFDTNDYTAIQFVREVSGSAIQVGTITCTSSATAYNTSSDYRLKENLVPLEDAAVRLKQIPVHRFNFINDPGKTVNGFLAHEVQDVVPEAITGDKDAVDEDGNPVYQGIDQSKLVPLLTAALQEAIGEIESLKARVAALESV